MVSTRHTNTERVPSNKKARNSKSPKDNKGSLEHKETSESPDIKEEEAEQVSAPNKDPETSLPDFLIKEDLLILEALSGSNNSGGDRLKAIESLAKQLRKPVETVRFRFEEYIEDLNGREVRTLKWLAKNGRENTPANYIFSRVLKRYILKEKLLEDLDKKLESESSEERKSQPGSKEGSKEGSHVHQSQEPQNKPVKLRRRRSIPRYSNLPLNPRRKWTKKPRNESSKSASRDSGGNRQIREEVKTESMTEEEEDQPRRTIKGGWRGAGKRSVSTSRESIMRSDSESKRAQFIKRVQFKEDKADQVPSGEAIDQKSTPQTPQASRKTSKSPEGSRESASKGSDAPEAQPGINVEPIVPQKKPRRSTFIPGRSYSLRRSSKIQNDSQDRVNLTSSRSRSAKKQKEETKTSEKRSYRRRGSRGSQSRRATTQSSVTERNADESQARKGSRRKRRRVFGPRRVPKVVKDEIEPRRGRGMKREIASLDFEPGANQTKEGSNQLVTRNSASRSSSQEAFKASQSQARNKIHLHKAFGRSSKAKNPPGNLTKRPHPTHSDTDSPEPEKKLNSNPAPAPLTCCDCRRPLPQESFNRFHSSPWEIPRPPPAHPLPNANGNIDQRIQSLFPFARSQLQPPVNSSSSILLGLLREFVEEAHFRLSMQDFMSSIVPSQGVSQLPVVKNAKRRMK